MKKQNRLAIVITLLVSLVLSGLTRQLADTRREIAGAGGRPAASSRRSSLSSMNSFALALLLGGLRGPLVMILWTQSEQQKQEKNLEGFDTRIEWIRLLQPEFDTVHIFQMWNKAYNVSVQMAGLANKYTTILDAIDYGHEVDAGRPDNINIIYSIGQIYFDKLGSSAEKQYYRKRVRAETQPHVSRQKQDRDDPAWRRLELDPLVDAEGKVLPQYLVPTHPRPDGLSAAADWYDGSEQQFLKPFEPFHNGVSPFAIAYNYYKRCQILQTQAKQQHAQLSPTVVHSRPALALKYWSEEEWEYGRLKELPGLGVPVPADLTEKPVLELPTAKFAFERLPNDPTGIAQAIYSYGRAAEIARAAKVEFEHHLKGEFRANQYQYQSYLDQLDASIHYLEADRDYLLIRSANGDAKSKLIDSAAAGYHQAMRLWAMMIIRYYLDPQAAAQLFPKGISGQEIALLTDEQLVGILVTSTQLAQQAHGPSYRNEDRAEYESYISRCLARMQKLER